MTDDHDTNPNADMPTDDDAAPTRGQINLTIFDRLCRAQRRRLPGGWCGLIYGGTLYPCFEGHDRYTESYLWEERYAGPDFCADANWIRTAEEELVTRGWRGPYLERLLARVYPRWEAVTDAADVVDFWFCLAHAAPVDRARSMYELLTARDAAAKENRANGNIEVVRGRLPSLAGPPEDGATDPARTSAASVGGASADSESLDDGGITGEPVDREEVLRSLFERAVELAAPLADLTGEPRTAAEGPFLTFVSGLPIERARALLALMYWGRGDHPSFAANLRAVSHAPDGPTVIARRMLAKAPLSTYLRDGLAKWNDWTRRP